MSFLPPTQSNFKINHLGDTNLVDLKFPCATRNAGGGERPHPGHTQHFQRAAGLPHLVAHLCHHGSSNVCWKILQGKKTRQ